MVGFVKDRRGAVAIQVALMLPILIIILLGAYEVWKVLYMQQVLNDAAYQGVRLLAFQPRGNLQVGDYTSPEVYEMADKLVRRYVSQAPFIDPELRLNPDNGTLLGVAVDRNNPAQCGAAIYVEATLQWTIGREWGLNSSSEWLPFLGKPYALHGRATGNILCERDQDAG